MKVRNRSLARHTCFRPCLENPILFSPSKVNDSAVSRWESLDGWMTHYGHQPSFKFPTTVDIHICTPPRNFKYLSHLHHLRKGRIPHLGAEKESYNSEAMEQLLVGGICGESLTSTSVSKKISRQTESFFSLYSLLNSHGYKPFRLSLPPNAPSTRQY